MFRFSLACRMAVFSEQSPVLMQASRELKLSSHIWVEDWVVNSKRYSDVLVPPKLAATSVSTWKALELYNSDQLQDANTGESLIPPEVNSVHSSYATMKPYGRAMAKEMENICAKKGYASKWWIGNAKTYGNEKQFIAKQGERTHKFYMTASMKLYPLDKLQGAGADDLRVLPISGSSRKFMPKNDFSSTIMSAASEREYGIHTLYFSDRQLQNAQMAVREGEQPIAVSNNFTSSSRDDAEGSGGDSGANVNFFVYNIEQINDWENLLQSMGRYGAPEEPVYLLSGNPVQSSTVLQAQQERGYTQKYWLSGRDLQQIEGNPTVKASEANNPVTLGGQFYTQFYNVSQLVNPTEGYQRAGLLDKK